MIKLKTEVNKSQIMRELQEDAIKSYEQTWQKELQIQAYMNGVHDLFKKLRISDVSKSVCDHYFPYCVDENGKVLYYPCEFCGEEKQTGC